MAKITISTYELFQMFPDQEAARIYLESRLWPNGPRCPVCGLGERITVRAGGYYRCNQCKEDFTVRTGTIFERSHIPLHKWLYAMYLLVTARKGISSLQLSKEIGITQKSAWFMLHRLREACGPDLERLRGNPDSGECLRRIQDIMNENDPDCPRCRGGGCEWCHNTGRRPATACDIVTVSVSGLTGSGKSAICGEIEIALKAIGLVVRWPDGDDEKRAAHADWAMALDRYRPEVLIQEINIARIPPGYFGGDILVWSKP